jgi:hypothetical protein
MKKLFSMLIVFSLLFSLSACGNKTETNFSRLVEYIKINGEENGTMYSITTNFSDLSKVYEEGSGFVTISIDASDVLHLEETYSDTNTITHIEYQLGQEDFEVKTTWNFSSDSQSVSSAKFGTKYTPYSSDIKDFKADNTAAGLASAHSLLTKHTNLLLVRADKTLEYLNIGVSLKDIGLPNGDIHAY